MKMKAVIGVIAALALVVAACGDDDDSDETSSAMSSVCDAQEQVLSDIEAIVAADPASTTVSDYQSMVDSLESSVSDLASAEEDLGQQKVDDVQSAFSSLQDELSGLDDVPLAEVPGDVASTVATAVDDFGEAYVSAFQDSSCPPTTTTS